MLINKAVDHALTSGVCENNTQKVKKFKSQSQFI